MTSYFSSDFTLGILSGGQLDKMFLTEARKLDIATRVLDPSAEAPCRIGSNAFVQGSLTNFDTVYQFDEDIQILAIEVENVNVDALEELQTGGMQVYPSPQTIQQIQNKAMQKQFYATSSIPAAPFMTFESLTDLCAAAEIGALKLPLVWESVRFGYGGSDVRIARQLAGLNGLSDGQCIAETLVPFAEELAVIVARSSQGEIRTYPVVEMEFHPEASQVGYIIYPAHVDDAAIQRARAIAVQVAKALGMIGLLVVELFQAADNKILVNEVASHPHNSGHYSIEAAYTSQFEQRLRAILGLPLGNTQSKVTDVMANLVGTEGEQGGIVYENIAQVLAMEGITPHIYGKKETRPFRKMEHVTIVNPEVAQARAITEQVKRTIRVIVLKK